MRTSPSLTLANGWCACKPATTPAAVRPWQSSSASHALLFPRLRLLPRRHLPQHRLPYPCRPPGQQRELPVTCRRMPPRSPCSTSAPPTPTATTAGLATPLLPGDTSLFSLTAKQSGTTRYISLDYAGAAQDFESLSNPAAFASVTVRATDESGLTVDRTVTISVTDVNEAPEPSARAPAPRVSLPENSAGNVNVGSPISATDPEGNTLYLHPRPALTPRPSPSTPATGQLATTTGAT